MSICMETMGVWNAMILYRKVWNLLSSVWKSSVFVWITWFETLYVVYGLGLETPKLISY